jgi:dihydrofolate reductase
MTINLIAAIGRNGELGANGGLVWNNRDDKRRFKQLTIDNVVIVGKRTFDGDLGGQRLANRINIVLTSSALNYDVSTDDFGKLYYVTNPATALQLAKSFKKDVFVIGGSQIYNIFLPHVEKMYITYIFQDFPNADTYFQFVNSEWEIEKTVMNDGYSYVDYVRRK